MKTFKKSQKEEQEIIEVAPGKEVTFKQNVIISWVLYKKWEKAVFNNTEYIENFIL